MLALTAGCPSETSDQGDQGLLVKDGPTAGLEAGTDGPRQDKAQPSDSSKPKKESGAAKDSAAKDSASPDAAKPACVDQCNLGDTRTKSGKTETCKLVTHATGKPAAITKGLHDRSRVHNAWIRKNHLPAGQLANARFKTTSHKTVVGWGGTGDSAIWTGTYLAAEAFRLKVTGAPDARANVRKLVEAVHQQFKVHGHPGYLARFSGELGKDSRIDAHYDAKDPTSHKVTYKGKSYFWEGDTSRDQYQGVLLGYSMAYDVLTSASHKQMIREDMVNLATELLKERKNIKITIEFYALGKWQKFSVPVKLKHVVMNPSEYSSGGPYVQVGEKSNPTAYEKTVMRGFREYFPDFSYLLKQVPLIGLLVPSVPRAGSAIMLANIMRIAIQTTNGVAAYAKQNASFKATYAKEINGWLKIMKGWISSSALQCWKGYFGHNIDLTPLYNLIRLEPNKILKAAFAKDVLEKCFWKVVKNHKNVWFSYIYTSQGPATSSMAAPIAAATAQLKQFPDPPQADKNIDLTKTGKYPLSKNCKDQSSVALDVKDRMPDDFIWQREPFKLKNSGDPKSVYPGADYLLTYWMARRYGYLKDDSAGICLRWQ